MSAWILITFLIRDKNHWCEEQSEEELMHPELSCWIWVRSARCLEQLPETEMVAGAPWQWQPHLSSLCTVIKHLLWGFTVGGIGAQRYVLSDRDFPYISCNAVSMGKRKSKLKKNGVENISERSQWKLHNNPSGKSGPIGQSPSRTHIDSQH